MKKLCLIIIIGGGVFFLLPPTATPKAKAIAFFDQLIGKKSRFEEVKYEPNTSYPWLAESRAKATTYRPLSRFDTGVYAVPSAHASIIIDADSGDIMFENNAHQQRQIASLTKIFTALLVMENLENLDTPITITEEALDVDGTKVGCPNTGVCTGNTLLVGEQVRARDLLKGALMNSTNDAITALGMHVAGGSQQRFVELMNRRAKELGLVDSHFCTPSGLEIDGREQECYSSAHDIARITVEALKYPVLWDIMRIQSETITSVDGTRTHDIANTNRLLGQMPNLLGTKTGFTPLAGYSLMAAASDASGKRKVVAVVLDDQNRWESIESMIMWSFDTHEWK